MPADSPAAAGPASRGSASAVCAFSWPRRMHGGTRRAARTSTLPTRSSTPKISPRRPPSRPPPRRLSAMMPRSSPACSVAHPPATPSTVLLLRRRCHADAARRHSSALPTTRKSPQRQHSPPALCRLPSLGGDRAPRAPPATAETIVEPLPSPRRPRIASDPCLPRADPATRKARAPRSSPRPSPIARAPFSDSHPSPRHRRAAESLRSGGPGCLRPMAGRAKTWSTSSLEVPLDPSTTLSRSEKSIGSTRAWMAPPTRQTGAP